METDKDEEIHGPFIKARLPEITFDEDGDACLRVFDEDGKLVFSVDKTGIKDKNGEEMTALSNDGWISVEDRLPSIHENVVMLRNDVTGLYAEVGWWNGETWMNGQAITDVAYWLPLPELPKEEETNESSTDT